MIFGAAYYPEHRDPSKWEYDLDRMAEMHVNTLRVGEFAWVRFEPSDGQYTFEWMDRFAELAVHRDIRLLMCPPLRTIPAWLQEQEPELKILTADGKRLEYGSRYSFCINHPLLREKGMALAARMAERYGDSDAVMGWHLDNEYGDEPDCHCPVCKAKFHEYLKDRYGTVGNLNEAWGTVFWGLDFNDFSQVPTPMVSKTVHNPGLLNAWRQFRSDCTVEVINLHAESVRTHAAVDKPITTNYQNWNTRTDYYDASRTLDVTTTNYYPPYGGKPRHVAFTLSGLRSYKDGQGFWVVELRNGPHGKPAEMHNTPEPGEVELLTAHTIANGSDGTFYFRWRGCPFGAEQTHGTLTDYDGRPKKVYAEAQRIGEKLDRIGDALEETRVRSEIAFFYDFPTRWMMETGSIWEGPRDVLVQHIRRCYDAVRANNVNCDAVGRDQDFSKYKLIIVPAVQAMDDQLADKLLEYVRGGGTLIWHPLSGLKNRDATVYPDRIHPKLKPLIGSTIREYATSGVDQYVLFKYGEDSFAASIFFDLPEDVEGEVLTTYTSGWFTGTPAVIRNRVGEGTCIYVTGIARQNFYEAMIGELMQALRIEPILDADLPPNVELSERSAEDGSGFIFLLNNNPGSVEINLPGEFRDVWNDETVEGTTALSPWQVRVLERS
ncbi:MAG: beta-galactosidase [Phycisphaerae bacterium]